MKQYNPESLKYKIGQIVSWKTPSQTIQQGIVSNIGFDHLDLLVEFEQPQTTQIPFEWIIDSKQN